MLLHQFGVGRLSSGNTPACRTPRRRRSSRRDRSRRRIRRGLPNLLKLPRIVVHGALHFSKVHLNIIKDTLLQGPSEEIQLPNRGLKEGLPRNLEHNSLTPAEGIKQFFTVCLQLRLIVRIHEELLVVKNIRDIMLLRIVRNEPVNQAQGNLRRALQKFEHLLLILSPSIKSL